jgi:DNA-binding transcriptional LysR family regulator
MAVDSRKLSYFVAIVDQGSLSGASSRLGISQVALSKAVRSLESDLQVRLLDRSPRGISATAYGRSLYEHAKTVGSALDRARAEIDHMRDRAHSHITIGALPDLADNIIPRATALFCREYADVRINVREYVTPDLLTGLRKHEFDIIIGLLTTLDNEAGLRRQGLFDDSLSVIVGSGHPLAARRTLTVKDLTGFPWVFLNYGGSFRPRLQQLFRQAGCELPSPQIECASIAFAKSVIREGHHLGALPLHALRDEVEVGVVKPLPIKSPTLSRRVVAIHLENHPISPMSRDFITAIRRVGREAATTAAIGSQQWSTRSS